VCSRRYTPLDYLLHLSVFICVYICIKVELKLPPVCLTLHTVRLLVVFECLSVCVCMCVNTYIHICMYVCMHIYIFDG